MVEFVEIQKKVKNKIREITAYLVDLRNENSELKAKIRNVERSHKRDREQLLKSEIFMV